MWVDLSNSLSLFLLINKLMLSYRNLQQHWVKVRISNQGTFKVKHKSIKIILLFFRVGRNFNLPPKGQRYERRKVRSVVRGMKCNLFVGRLLPCRSTLQFSSATCFCLFIYFNVWLAKVMISSY